MKKLPVVKNFVTAMFFMLSFLSALPWEKDAGILPRFLIPFFFLLFSSVLTGLFRTESAAFLFFLLRWILFSEKSFFDGFLLPFFAVGTAIFVSSYVYEHYEAILYTTALSLLTAWFSYGILSLFAKLFTGISYSLHDFWCETVGFYWPGILLIAFLLPLGIFLLRKTPVLRTLRNEQKRR